LEKVDWSKREAKVTKTVYTPHPKVLEMTPQDIAVPISFRPFGSFLDFLLFLLELEEGKQFQD
jgi:hypothetical protein